MKISQYISLLILVCMSLGLFAAGVIYIQSHAIDKNQLTLLNLSQNQTKCKNIDTLLSQWLLTVDLYLVNKQTYLYKSIRHEGIIIKQMAEDIRKDADPKYFNDLETFISKIISVQGIIKKCQDSSLLTNTYIWEQSLNKTDSETENIDVIIKILTTHFDNLLTQKNLEIQFQKNRLNISAYCIFLALALTTILTLRYARKFIVLPLERLSKITEKENLKQEDFFLKGPKEVKALANKFGNYILALMKARELAMAESELTKFANARIRNIMETAGDAIVCTDEKGNIFEMNHSFRQLSSININKYPSPQLNEFIPDLELTQMDDIDSCKLISFSEATLFSKNNDEIPVEISTSSFSSPGGRLYTIIIRNIADRKELLEQLLNAQKLESIGRLAAGIAHEINTPAQYIMDYNRFIKDGFGDLFTFIEKAHALQIKELEDFSEEKQLSFYEEEIPNAIKGSLFGLEQISRIVKSVKGFMHPQQADKTLYNVNNIIKDTINVSRNEWKYDAEIEVNLDENLPDFHCFPVRLNQVFLNLIINAAQAIHEKNALQENPQKGKITISSEFRDDAIVIHVKDTGLGIAEENKNKIFEPFFTTKEVGVGTGQGLALSYDFIVNKHDGQIKFLSTPGQGTEFIISLPLSCQIRQAG